jgi:hypothetical protein
MPVKMPIYRLSKIQHETEMDLLREFVRQAAEILKQNPKPDTFLGRKTREPFPYGGNWQRRLNQGADIPAFAGTTSPRAH